MKQISISNEAYNLLLKLRAAQELDTGVRKSISKVADEIIIEYCKLSEDKLPSLSEVASAATECGIRLEDAKKFFNLKVVKDRLIKDGEKISNWKYYMINYVSCMYDNPEDAQIFDSEEYPEDGND
ncbi:MAG: hypothetical protein MJZ10_14600 [Fibrobacter sp.]|nr:hypothetical protein [Fibrobacter sp.]